MDLLAAQSWAYIPDLPDDIEPIRKLLLEYSNINVEDIDKHILQVRENAWKASRFPCVGRWKFLRLTDQNDPCYQQVLFRLKVPKSEDAFLDLGCCVGQVLRQLRHDGVEGRQLYGTDVQAKFIDIGYELFRDKDGLGATFVVGDMLDPEDNRLSQLANKVTIIYAGSFFHLFNWTEQLYIGIRLVGFLKKGTRNALIYGRHAGTTNPGVPDSNNTGVYLHDQHTFQRLWDEIGKATNSKWTVELEAVGDSIDEWPQITKDVQPVNFVTYQIS